jgi:hypothetical protein
VQAGGWPAPLGITLVADRVSTIMLVVGSIMLLAVLVYAIGEPGAERNHVGFQSVYLVLAAGVSASLLTADDEVQDDVGDRAVARTDVVEDEVADQESVIAREELS